MEQGSLSFAGDYMAQVGETWLTPNYRMDLRNPSVAELDDFIEEHPVRLVAALLEGCRETVPGGEYGGRATTVGGAERGLDACANILGDV